jgi:hypothetical protein
MIGSSSNTTSPFLSDSFAKTPNPLGQEKSSEKPLMSTSPERWGYHFNFYFKILNKIVEIFCVLCIAFGRNLDLKNRLDDYSTTKTLYRNIRNIESIVWKGVVAIPSPSVHSR